MIAASLRNLKTRAASCALCVIVALALASLCGCDREKPIRPAPIEDRDWVYPGGPVPEDLSPMTSLLPPDPLVFLYSPDLSGLVQMTRNSTTLDNYMRSSAYGRFLESRLILKLKDRIGDLTSLAGAGSKAADLATLAGDESAFALYDIGELKFIYVARLSEEALTQTALWAARDKARKSSLSGETFFAFESGESEAKLFFAAEDGMLILSNDMDLFGRSLSLSSRPAGHKDKPEKSLASSQKFVRAFPAGLDISEMVMYLDQAALLENSYFNSYWIYDNHDDLAWIDTVVIDLALAPGSFRERRFFGGRPAYRANAALPECEWALKGDLVGECGVVRDSDQAAGKILSVLGLAPGLAASQKDSLDDGSSDEAWKVLADLLAPAEPADQGAAARLDWSEDKIFWRLEQSVAIRLARPGKLDVNQVSQAIRDAWSSMLHLGGEGAMAWEKDDYGTVLKTALFDRDGLWLDRAGEYLVVSNSGILHREALDVLGRQSSGNKSAGEGHGALYRCRWDLVRARMDARRIAEALGRDNSWPSLSSERAIEDDLLGLALSAGADRVEREVSLNKGMVQEIIKASRD